jgi:adenosylhomocysteine nucleosidase
MDADGVTLACATTAELRAARRARVRSALVGLRAVNGVPEGPLVSFGLAGALHDGLPVGTVLDATRVVAEDGSLLWEGPALGVAGGREATILAAAAIAHSAEERRALHERTGADAADLESGPLARSGRLHGVLRVVSDTPERPLNGIESGVKESGVLDWPGLLRAFARSPRGFARAAADGRRALGRLASAAEAMR